MANSFRFKRRHVEILSWESGQPWPEKISIDGTVMDYAAWIHTARGIVVYYVAPGSIERHGIPKSLFIEQAKED